MSIEITRNYWLKLIQCRLNLVKPFLHFIYLLFTLIPFSINCQTTSLTDSIHLLKLDSIINLGNYDDLNFQKALDLIDEVDLKNSGMVIPYLDKLIDSANEKDDYIRSAKLNKILGLKYMAIYNRPLAGIAYENAIHNYKLADFEEGILDMHYTLSGYYACTDRSDTALKHAYEAIAICESNNDKDGVAKANLSIAFNLGNFSQFEKANEFVNKALVHYESVNNQKGLISALTQHASIHLYLENFEEALISTNKAIEISKALNIDPTKVIRYYLIRADIYRDSGDLEKLDEQLNFLWDNVEHLSPVYRYKLEMETADCAHLKGEHEKAKRMLLKVFNRPDTSQNTYLIYSYGLMSRIYAKLNQYDSVYYYHMLTHNEAKTEKYEKSNKERDELMVRYEMGKKEAMISSQKEIISQQRIIQWFIGGVTALLGLLFYQALKNSKARAASNDNLQHTVQQLEVKNKENEILLKEIHHRVKNNLQTVSSLLSLQSASISDAQVLEAIEDSKKRVDSIALIHQKLYQGENLASIEMREYFMAIGQTIIESFGMSREDILFKVEMPKLELDVDTAVPIGLITNELITNSLKHAFTDTQEAKISISMQTEQDNSILLLISDNGTHKEANPSSKNSTGFGSMLIKLLAKQLGAELKTSTKNGTETLLKFKRKTMTV